MTPTALFQSLVSLLHCLPRVWVWIISLTLVLLVGALDLWSGYEVSAVLFYSLPILLMVWLSDKTSAIFIALCCAIVWWWADETSGHDYTHQWHQAWETVVKLIYFLLFVEGGSAIRSRLALLERSRCLEQEIVRISEREKASIGRDLHDGLCQYFAAIGCAAGSLKRALGKQGVPQAERAGEIEDLIMKGVAQARSLARGLFPVENDAAGLQSALRELAASATRLLNLPCTFECQGPAPIFDNVSATHLYRIAQESISNASRHGKARSATIRLTASPREVSLTVTDDGVGLPEGGVQSKGMGIGIMQYRARIIDGEFQIGPRPGGGTFVRCFFTPHS